MARRSGRIAAALLGIAAAARRHWPQLGAALLLVGLTVLLLLPLASAATFTDVPAGYPYYTAIDQLSNSGIISGYGDGTFGPGNPVTRQQFAKLICRDLGVTVPGNSVCPFPDVTHQPGSDPLYPEHYVARAAQLGLTTGYPDGLFHPWNNISRFQVITMVVRGAQSVYPGLLDTPPAGFHSTWNEQASAVHSPMARIAEYNGLLTGMPLAQLDPWAPMPRGEVAQVLWCLLQRQIQKSTTTTTSSSTTTTQWQASHFEDLGGGISYPPSAATPGPGQLMVFGSGTDSLLHFLYYNSGWSAWASHPHPAMLGRPAASWQADGLYVFAHGSSDQLYFWFPGEMGSLTGGGGIIGDPYVVSPSPGRLDVFWIGGDGHLYHDYGDLIGGGRTSWHGQEDWGEPPSGMCMSSPTAVFWGGGWDVYVRGTEGQLWHRGWMNGLAPWDSLGGSIQGQPAAVSWGYGRVDVFAWGTGDDLWHLAWNLGQGWQIESLGGSIRTSPSVVSWGPDHLDVYVRGFDNALWHRYWHNGSWAPEWERLGHEFQGTPYAVSWGPSRIDVFGWSGPATNDVLHWWYDGSW